MADFLTGSGITATYVFIVAGIFACSYLGRIAKSLAEISQKLDKK